MLASVSFVAKPKVASKALVKWQNERALKLDQVAKVHESIGGRGPGRRRALDQIVRAGAAGRRLVRVRVDLDPLTEPLIMDVPLSELQLLPRTSRRAG